MIRSLTHLPAPAKINWFLHVVGRHGPGTAENPNPLVGKHKIQSLMQLIDLQDVLHIEVTDSASIERRDAGDTPADMPRDDLCVRAASALQSACQISQGCVITLEKRIPSGAGLGGGSSDAATTLLALNQLWQCKLNDAQLCKIALTLGADVPFFLRRLPAWVEGIGEVLSEVVMPVLPLLIIKPQAAVPTAAVYQHLALKRDTPTTSSSIALNIERKDIYTLMSITANDLFPIACLIAPEVNLALELARAHALQPALARMSGSGSAVFAVVDEQQAYLQHLNLPAGWRAWRVQTLAQHPLHERLGLAA
jgi:4-diphosphocytidyl-2-C-methyl-D-erythritol kinase